MAFKDWKTEEFKKVDVRGIQGNFFPGLKKQAMGLPAIAVSGLFGAVKEQCSGLYAQTGAIMQDP